MSRIEAIGMDALIARVRRWPDAIADATATLVHTEVRDMASDMRSRAGRYGGAARIAASSVQTREGKDFGTITAGGGGLAGELLYGAEFGGQRAPRRAYVTRSRRGRPYIVRRRTTQQFHPHLGHHGYWFYPTVREDMRGIYGRVRATIIRAMGG